MDEKEVNSQEAEADVIVPVVAPVPVDVRETAVIRVTDDEGVLRLVALSSASKFVLLHPTHQTFPNGLVL